MRILLITGFFPPNCPAATTRVPSLARYLLKSGHDVRVLCPRILQYKPVLRPGVSPERLHYVDLPDVNALSFWLKTMLSKFKPQIKNVSKTPSFDGSDHDQKSPVLKSSMLRRLFNWLYIELLYFPDTHWPWIRPALAEADVLIKSWRPDVIFVSSPPYSQLFVGRILARKYSIPWSLEYRDTWVEQPYYTHNFVRRWVEAWVERWVTKSASSVFCVTELATKDISKALGRPVLCARNGYDPEDFAGLDVGPPLDAQKLSILYGGAIYGGKRDPSPLFKALKLLENAEQKYVVMLYTDQQEEVRKAAITYDVEQMVHLHGSIRREEFLRLELCADVLLLMRGPGSDEDGVIPGKIFEYIGAGRPVLALGSTTGEAVDILHKENLGLASNDPETIARQLESWYKQKMQAGGQLPKLMTNDPERYSREQQFIKIESNLREISSLKIL